MFPKPLPAIVVVEVVPLLVRVLKIGYRVLESPDAATHLIEAERINVLLPSHAEFAELVATRRLDVEHRILNQFVDVTVELHVAVLRFERTRAEDLRSRSPEIIDELLHDLHREIENIGRAIRDL